MENLHLSHWRTEEDRCNDLSCKNIVVEKYYDKSANMLQHGIEELQIEQGNIEESRNIDIEG